MTLQIKNLLVRIIRRAFDLLLRATDLSSRAVKWVKPRKAHPAFNPGDHSREGITVIIPERDSPEMLADCLKAAAGALALVDAPGEIVVVVNGADPGRYDTVKKSFPRVRWEHFIQPLGFGAAIQRGLEAANYSWVYLLNSDMLLDRRALIELWPFRGDDVFALASQIFFQDPEKRREETGFTALRVANGEIELFDAEPLDPDLVCDHLYAGGGSSLFQRGPLTRYVENAHVYAPFYWEDVEWGVRARRDGLEVLFVPKSHAWHKHRATVSRFYSPEEVREIFEVNSWQCLVRNRLAHGKSQPLPWVRSVTGKQVWGMVKSRWLLWQSGWPERPRGENAVSYYPARPAPDDPRPWMIIATPFALFPTRHGGAVRMMNLSRFLSNHFRLALLSDEADLYPVDRLKELTRFQRVHLIKGRPETSTRPPARMARMRSHAHSLMRRELSRMIANLKPAIVQIEYSELAGLVRSRDG
ncbi:MAG: glycosyltransferase, partial [Desulfobacterales bacterium]|nr:glycosyltransferase [Desulfobacterales bacterium]